MLNYFNLKNYVNLIFIEIKLNFLCFSNQSEKDVKFYFIFNIKFLTFYKIAVLIYRIMSFKIYLDNLSQIHFRSKSKGKRKMLKQNHE